MTKSKPQQVFPKPNAFIYTSFCLIERLATDKHNEQFGG